MLDEFRDGRRDQAVFAAEKNGRYVQVRYFALRSKDGAYGGCFELAQWADEAGSAPPAE